ncbi:MAG: transporter, permease protein [Paenibacillus sp.]|jgi:multiple sugar transport system permease protein/raffinose/stachyose/melibiose transport system permease protein|nr:transporter, permease protein [Paenibacillus sp.]
MITGTPATGVLLYKGVNGMSTAQTVKRRKLRLSYAFIFILPAFLFYVLFVVVPTLSSVYLSMTSWDGVSPDIRYIGFDNFVELWQSDRVHNALKNTLILSVALVVLENGAAILLALLVDQVRWFRNFFRSAFYLPVLLSGVVMSFIWTVIYNYNFGVLNQLFEAWGLAFLKIDWLGDSRYTMIAIVFSITWKSAGYYMIIYLAALQSVPQELMEASRIDGANRWQQFRHITFPLLAGAVTVCTTLSMINSLKVFDQIAVMTDGGPGFATETLTYIVYKVGFGEMRQGYGTALALALFAIILIVSLIQVTLLRKREVQM